MTQLALPALAASTLLGSPFSPLSVDTEPISSRVEVPVAGAPASALLGDVGGRLTITCPEDQKFFCGPSLDPDTMGSFVEDCAVCCRPWLVTVERDERRRLRVHASRAQ